MRLRLTVLSVLVAGFVVLASAGTASANNYGHDYGHNAKSSYGYGGAGHGNVHCMRYGETLYGVAYRYGTTAHAIAYANGLYNPNYVRAGQCLKIPGGSHGYGGYGYDASYGKKAPSYGHYDDMKHPMSGHGGYDNGKQGYGYGYAGGNTYCVRYGDTLSSIAYRYGTSSYAIAHHNGIYNANYIRAGQCLKIPAKKY